MVTVMFPIVPDLIVLDIDGEAEIGQTLLAQAEAHPALSTLPIVALTWESHFPAGMREGDMRGNAPARVYLTKPFDVRALHIAIEQLLLDVEESKAARKQENYLATRRATVASFLRQACLAKVFHNHAPAGRMTWISLKFRSFGSQRVVAK